MHVLHVVVGRPNFVKAAPVLRALRNRNVRQTLVHTGQHLRANTERPVTVTIGTNILVGDDKEKLTTALRNILTGNAKKGAIPPLWYGHAGDRIAAAPRLYE